MAGFQALGMSYGDEQEARWAREAAEKKYEQERLNANAGADVRGNLGRANKAIGSMVDAAKDAQIQNSATSELIRAGVPGVKEDALTQRKIAGQFGDMATEAQGQATPWLGVGNDIRDLDAGAGGIAGEWVKNYNALSPDSLVSFAASDAQKSIENTRGQLTRTLSRSGISPSSPAYVAALGEAKKYEQALLAGVKTRARLLGLKEQGGALAQGMQMALQSTAMGDQITKRAMASLEGASGATSAATAAEQGAAELGIKASAQGMAGTNYLANAQQVAADYYSTQASSTLGLLQSGAKTALSALFS
jgi:hypothetical protein